jgi:tyrosine-protein kinase Etk/Wzc
MRSVTPFLSNGTPIQKSFAVNDQGKNTGMLELTYVGDNPDKISQILRKISDNISNLR